MSNAFNNLEMLLNSTDPKYDENIRLYQGCPSIAITKGGRIFATWCSGGCIEPSIHNYNVVVYSDDNGNTWSAPVLIFPSSERSLTQVLDQQLWISPEGKLFIFISRDDVVRNTGTDDVNGHIITSDYIFLRNNIANWLVVCDQPDEKELKFNSPVCWSTGIMRTNPLVMSNGEWLLFNNDPFCDTYTYTISADKGKTFTRYNGPVKQAGVWLEPMAYQKRNGNIHMFARCALNKIAQAESSDYARTWTESSLTDITAPDSRMFVARTPSGRLLLVHNDHPSERTNMTVALSEDDGNVWKYKKLVDSRRHLSYPDVDFFDGKIYLIYDRERCGKNSAREILMTCFTEEDIMKDNFEFEISCVSKPSNIVTEHLPNVIYK